jgi:TonB family protein
VNWQRILASVLVAAPGIGGAEPVATMAPPAVVAVAPEYPAIAHQASIEGVVTVRVTVDGRGKVSAATLVDGPKLLSQSALAAARLWEFKPGVPDSGQPEPAFAYTIVPETACFQRTLPRFVPPERVEVRARKVVPTCSDCGPPKPIRYETCE